MLTYLCETHFWTCDEDVTIKHTDLGAFKYESKKAAGSSAYVLGKRAWAAGRGGVGRPRRLAELVGLLRDHRLLHAAWRSPRWLALLFSTGTVAHVCVEPATGDLTRILFDRYLVGKLLSASVSEVLFTDTHILLTYNDNQAILVNFNRPSIKSALPEKLSNRDPKFQTVELVGGWRRGGRQVSGSPEGTAALVWSRASPSDLFPWSPRAPHEDHANVHVYSLQGSQMSLICFHRIEFDPLCVSFSNLHENIIFSVEQKTSRKGGVLVEWRRLELNGGALRVVSEVRLAAPAPATCSARSPCETRLLLACSDRSVLLHHAAHNVTTTVTAAFVARTCCWARGGRAVLLGGAGAQLQCWDSALAPARLATSAEHLPAEPCLDLAAYFRKEPVMSSLLWNPHGLETGGDGLLLATMQGGPLACVRLLSSGVPQEEEAEGICIRGQEAGALARLRSLDWSAQGPAALALLHRITNCLFSAPLTLEREELAQAALGTFLAPPQPLPPTTRATHLPQLHDLCRRFFHHLLRYGRLEKALCLALDVGHQDLFMDVHYAAINSGHAELASEARLRALDAASSCESSCSRLSCSRCSGSGSSGCEESAGEEAPARQLDLYGAPRRSPPPLPTLPPAPRLPLSSSPAIQSTLNSLPRKTLPPPPTVLTVPQLPRQTNLVTSGARVLTERESFPWGVGPSAPRVLHRVLEVIPQPALPEAQSALELFQAELTDTRNAAYSITSPSERPTRLERPRMTMSPLKAESLASIYTPVYHQYPLLAGRIPPPRPLGRDLRRETRPLRPPVIKASVIEGEMPSKPPGEKNKVKFSDTVTVAVVPEIPRKERARARPPTGRPDPRRELADSLPLCHPHHDYLKDFTPQPESEEPEKQGKIKVVHFGVV